MPSGIYDLTVTGEQSSWNSIELLVVKAFTELVDLEIDFSYEGLISAGIEAGLHEQMLDGVSCRLAAPEGPELCTGLLLGQVEQTLQCFFDLHGCKDALSA